MNRIQSGSTRGANGRPRVRHIMLVAFLAWVSTSLILEAWPVHQMPLPEEDKGGMWLSEHLELLSVHVATASGKPIPMVETAGVFWNGALPRWNCVGLRQIEYDSSVRPKEIQNSHPSTRRGKEESTCLWVHPSNQGDLVLNFNDLPAWSSFHGYIHFLPSADPRASFDMVGEVNGQPVVHLSPKTSPGHFLTFQAKPEGVAGTGNSLTFRFRTLKKGKNHICMDVRLTLAEQAGEEDR